MCRDDIIRSCQQVARIALLAAAELRELIT
jgi:hypothetical protein